MMKSEAGSRTGGSEGWGGELLSNEQGVYLGDNEKV